MKSHEKRNIVDFGATSIEHIVDQLQGAPQRPRLARAVFVGRVLRQHLLYEGPVASDTGAPRLTSVANHPHVPFDYNYLWYAAAIAEQFDALPQGLGAELSISHHRRLLRVQDPVEKVRLASKVVAEKWPVKQLEAAIRATQSSNYRRGRPQQSELHRAVNALREARRALEILEQTPSTEAVSGLRRTEAREACRDLDEEAARIMRTATSIATRVQNVLK